MKCNNCGQPIILVKKRNGDMQAVNNSRHKIITDKGDILYGHEIHECPKENKNVLDLVEFVRQQKPMKRIRED